MWRTGREVALFDAREEGPFAQAHPFFAVPLPLSRVEAVIHGLVPRRSAPIVVYDDGEGLAEETASRLLRLGYTEVSVLQGGLSGYAREGEVFRDVNVPSKAFGELVEAIRHTPSLSAADVKQLIEQQADVVVLDVRRFEEYRTMCVPSAISVPGGEIALRVRDLAPSPDTLVVVNCAGRTRSIIGTQTLVNAGIPNRVAALRNGTIGWTLEGYSLDHGQARRFGEFTEQTLTAARDAAVSLADRTHVLSISGDILKAWVAEAYRRTFYRFDVRTPEEYATGHPVGFVSAPGGQLVQAIDEWVAVRGARIALFDDDGVRARMTGSWLAQMGWEVAVVGREAGLPWEKEISTPLRPPYSEARTIGVDELATLGEPAVVIDLAPSPVYERGHFPGAWFMLRSRFAQDIGQLPSVGQLVLTSPDGWQARYAAPELEQIAGRPVRVLTGDITRTVERDRHRWASPAIDVYKRPYEGTDNAPEAMRGYIEWELQLVAQLANDGIANFRVFR